MANQRIFLGRSTGEMESVGNSMSTKYCYWPEARLLKIFWKGREIFSGNARPGDAFVVGCYGSTPEVRSLGIPEKKEILLMWLLSFPKKNRNTNLKSYEKMLEEQRRKLNWSGYEDWTVSGENYRLKICNRPDYTGVYHLAAYVDRKITKKEIIKMLNDFGGGFCCPVDFARRILKFKIGLTDKDLAQIEELA